MRYCCESLSIPDCLYIEPTTPLHNATMGKHNLNFTLDFPRWGGMNTPRRGVLVHFPCAGLTCSSVADWWQCSWRSIWRQSTSRPFGTTSSLTATISLCGYVEACHVSFCPKPENDLLVYCTQSAQVFSEECWVPLGQWLPGLLCYGIVYPVNNQQLSLWKVKLWVLLMWSWSTCLAYSHLCSNPSEV